MKHRSKIVNAQPLKMPETDIIIIHNDITYRLSYAFEHESILDAAINEGINLPYSCKKGICGTCRAKLIEGEVEMELCYSLTREMIEQGYILTCQSHPKKRRVFVNFDI